MTKADDASLDDCHVFCLPVQLCGLGSPLPQEPGAFKTEFAERSSCEGMVVTGHFSTSTPKLEPLVLRKILARGWS